MARANLTTVNTLFTELQNLKALRTSFIAQGDQELGDAVGRAMRELQTDNVSGACNQVPGATFDVTRP
jgi:hypothetical protein